MRTSCNPATTRNGFTLVELLVAIALVAVAISLLLPAVQHAREQANRAVCMSNLRQFSFAFVQYETAYNHLPNGRHNVMNHIGRISEPGPGGCHIALRDRFGLTENATMCPSGEPTPRNAYLWTNNDLYARISYFYYAGYGNRAEDRNEVGYSNGAWPGRSRGFEPVQRLRRPKRPPSEHPIMSDYVVVPRSDNPSRPSPDFITFAGHYPNRSNHLRRTGWTGAGINVLFVDQHVEWQPLVAGKSWYWGGPLWWTPNFPPYDYPATVRYLPKEQ
jgi:prepilin-type N-terminal cleavage/methylation domain-containing protein